jgi:PPOX class probable F420-dependent enzyme
VARLGTVNDAGAVDLVPCTFAFVDDRTFVTAIDHKPKSTTALQRLANVRARPLVTVLIDHYEDDWTRLWWVRLRGAGRVVDAGADLDAAVDALVARYPQYQARRPAGPAIVVSITAATTWTASP